jgi:hypothetical protein
MDTTQVPWRPRRHQLEQKVRALERIHQQQFAPRHRRVRYRAGRQRSTEQHVVQRHRATPALARLFRGGEQLLGVRVRDNQLAFDVGEQDRVGDGVDDAVEQHPLLREAAFAQRPAAEQPRRLAPEHARDPRNVRHDGRRLTIDHQQSQCLRIIVGAERHGMESRRFVVRILGKIEDAADGQRSAHLKSADGNGRRCAGAHRPVEGMRHVVPADVEIGECARGHAVLGDEHQAPIVGIGEDDGGLTDADIGDEPVGRLPRRGRQVGAAQKKFRQGKLGFHIELATEPGRGSAGRAT